MKLFLIFLYLLPSGATMSKPSPRAAGHQASAQSDAFQQGLAALKEHRLDDALSELSIAERERPSDVRVRNFRGIVLAQLGKNAEAAGEYREAIRLDPRLEDAYRNLGFLEWNEHDLAPARAALQHAVKLAPSDGFAHYYLGRVELEAQRYPRAFHELEISGVPPPADPGYLEDVAMGYKALGRQEDARKSLDQLENLPLPGAQSIEVAIFLLKVHENDAAIRLIQNLRDPESSTPGDWQQFDLALAYLTAGNYKKAVEQSRLYTDAGHPDNPEPVDSAPFWSLIGIAYAHQNQREPCIDALRHAATLAPTEEEYWLNLTRELMEFARYPEAIAAAQSGLAANPKSYALHLRLGAVYLAAARYPDAEDVFRDLVAAGDPLPTGYVGLAQVLLRTGRANEAATELAVAERKLGPQFLLSYFRGLALDRAGKPSEALDAFQSAVKLNPNSAQAHLNLGKTELALGRVHQSIAELQMVLRLDPANAQAKRLLSQAYRRANDEKNAAKFAQASAEPPAPPAEGDLLSDLFVPRWVLPAHN
jgi:tetratricopeptide (TPR) repeat protein